MQKTFSPLSWTVAALICAGLWIGCANDSPIETSSVQTSADNIQTPKAPVSLEDQTETPLRSEEIYVAAKDEKAAKDTPKKLGALPANANHIPAGSTVTGGAHLIQAYERKAHHFANFDVLLQDEQGFDIAQLRHWTIFKIATVEEREALGHIG